MNAPSPMSSRRSAFTLIELLAVIAVIAVVIAFAVPATNQILRGSQLTQGTQTLGDQLSYAHQLAVTRNRPIEFRFYRFGDPETPGEDYNNPKSGLWRGFQLFELLENGTAVPAGAFQRLPRMVMLDGGTRSTLLSEDIMGQPHKGSEKSSDPELPVEISGKRVGKNYEYVSFKFLPDGSTSLPLKAAKRGGAPGALDAWYVTVINNADAKKQLSAINYSIIQIDPVTGSQKTFRPTIGGKKGT